jgi:hypothetical protein
MKSRFGKCENGIVKHWLETLYYLFFADFKNDFGLQQIGTKFQLIIFDPDIENPLGGGTLAKF